MAKLLKKQLFPGECKNLFFGGTAHGLQAIAFLRRKSM